MSVSQDERGMLARIAFFLCRDGEVPEAEAVFRGLLDSAPERDGAAVGLALSLIIQKRHDEALALLDARLARKGALTGPLSLYKLVALGMAGRLDAARAFREEMSRDGLDAYLGTADLLLGDLSGMGE